MAVYRCVRASPHQRGVRDAGGFVVRQRDSVRKILRSSRRVRQISAVASAIRSHYIGAAGLRGASGVIFSGPYRSLRELSLTGPVGSDIWRPPTFVGNPGSQLQRPSGSALFRMNQSATVESLKSEIRRDAVARRDALPAPERAASAGTIAARPLPVAVPAG